MWRRLETSDSTWSLVVGTGTGRPTHPSRCSSGMMNFNVTRSSSSGNMSHPSIGARCPVNTDPSCEDQSVLRGNKEGRHDDHPSTRHLQLGFSGFLILPELAINVQFK